MQETEGNKVLEFENAEFKDEPVRMTWAVHHIDGLLKDWHPSYIQRMRENAKAQAMREQRKTDAFKWTMIMIMVTVGLAIAWQIFQAGGGGSIASAGKSVTGTSLNGALLAGIRNKVRGGNSDS